MTGNGVATDTKLQTSGSGPMATRTASSHSETGNRLGPLRDLPGSWQGTGFSLTARPHFPGTPEGRGTPEGDVFLQLNLLQEILDFTAIGSPVTNRGSVQEDIAIYGVTYLHKVVDQVDGGALHIEPGMWLNIPPTSDPKSDVSIARMATIPHGNAACTVGFSQEAEFSRIPEIPAANTVPFPIGGTPPPAGTGNPYPVFDLSKATTLRTSPLADGITQALLDDPNQLLRDKLTRQVDEEGKTLRSITRLITSTDQGGVANIPFITRNADTPSMESVFAIETVVDEQGNESLQLQYSQTVLLDFNGMSFPHVTVGTLVKSF